MRYYIKDLEYSLTHSECSIHLGYYYYHCTLFYVNCPFLKKMQIDYQQEGRKSERLQIVCNSFQAVDGMLSERFPNTSTKIISAN